MTETVEENKIKMSEGNSEVPKPPKIAIACHAFEMIDFTVYHNHMFCLAHWVKMFNSVLIGKKGLQAADARNLMVEYALDSDCSHIFFMDADHYFHESALPLLMENSHRAIISGLVCKKGEGFPQVAFDVDKDGRYYALTLPLDGKVHKVGVCAFGCTLINLNKLKKLDPPFFRDTCKVSKPDDKPVNIRSDINVCNMFRDIGEASYIDARVLVGHHLGGDMTVYPQCANELNHAMNIIRLSERLKEGQNGFYFAL